MLGLNIQNLLENSSFIKLFKQTLLRIYMVSKKDDDFDSDEDDEKLQSKFSAGFLIVIFGIIFLILPETFFYLLSEKTGSSFGLTQMAFGLILAIVITLFLGWVRIILRSNKYTGLFVSILGTTAMIYALMKKYQGPYTITFGIIGAILILGYAIMQFVKADKR